MHLIMQQRGFCSLDCSTEKQYSTLHTHFIRGREKPIELTFRHLRAGKKNCQKRKVTFIGKKCAGEEGDLIRTIKIKVVL